MDKTVGFNEINVIGKRAEPRITMRVRLEAIVRSKGISISEPIAAGIKRCLDEKQMQLILDEGVYILIQPLHPVIAEHPEHDCFESVCIWALTGVEAFAFRKQASDNLTK